MTKESIQQLADIGYSDSEIEKEIEANKKKYPTKTVKPTLNQNHTSEVAIQYANDLVKYEVDLFKYNEENTKVNIFNSELDFVFQEYLEEKSGFTKLSDKEQSLVMDIHYEFGSKNNLIETYQEIESIVGYVNAIKQLNK